MLTLFLEDKKKQVVECIREVNGQGVDPEGFFYRALLLARLGEATEALESLERAVRGGFWCVPAFLEDSLETVRETASFRELSREAKTHSTEAAAAFAAAGGAQVLSADGPSVAR